MVVKQVKITNESGLHTRPAADFVRAAKQYEADITVRKLDAPDAPAVNAKSMLRLLTADIGRGAWVEIVAEGADEAAAAAALAALVQTGFGE